MLKEKFLTFVSQNYKWAACFYIIIIHFTIYLSIVTSSHGAPSIFDADYTKYGKDFSVFFFWFSTFLIALFSQLTYVYIELCSLNLLTKSKKRRYHYILQIFFHVLFFVSLHFITYILQIEILLNVIFNMFSCIAGADDIDSVYSLRTHIIHPQLSKSSYVILLYFFLFNLFCLWFFNFKDKAPKYGHL